MFERKAPPRVAVIGADGFIGKYLFKEFQKVYPGSIGTSYKPLENILQFDLRRPQTSRLELTRRGITHAVISAGISGISACENDPDGTRKINVDGIIETTEQLTKNKIRVIAFSSDYVFNGKTGSYDDLAPVHPLNQYGHQKAEMESGICAIDKHKCLILRLSKIYDNQFNSETLLGEMLMNLSMGKEIKAAKDQIFCPTYIGDVVKGVKELLQTSVSGIMNFCAPESLSRFSIAKKIAAVSGCNTQLVRQCTLSELNENFIRPSNTSMDCQKLGNISHLRFKSIDNCIEEMVCSLKSRQ